LRCEAGILLGTILKSILPGGWFLPVTPGTQFVSLGGAIANDVHGKNHHRSGSFGLHVRRFELLRSDGDRIVCSPSENANLYQATIGGLGLTGLITWAEIQLKAVPGPFVEHEYVPFGGIAEFLDLSRRLSNRYDYLVAWVDSLAPAGRLGRGILSAGNHAGPPGPAPEPKRTLGVPFAPPFGLVNRTSIRLFNGAYYHRHARLRGVRRSPYQPFFYPLDGIAHWNRLYGPKGLFQHQSVLPHDAAEDAVRELLARVARSGQGSFLTVLKAFGDPPAAGLLSFARPGVTLTLDFPNRGARTLELLDDLDRITVAAGGAVNPYKDARMSPATFRASFPRWRELTPFIDPRFSSSFWRRVTAAETRPS
jgi:FAD/FMN-containing dehydrogenase